jgi:dolichol kinase
MIFLNLGRTTGKYSTRDEKNKSYVKSVHLTSLLWPLAELTAMPCGVGSFSFILMPIKSAFYSISYGWELLTG